jgi:hypothetical protein
MIMIALRACIYSDTCQADAACHHPPRFQIYLDAPRRPQQSPIRRRSQACASHLGIAVQAMASWARAQHLTDGDLTVLTIDPPPGPDYLGHQPRCGHSQTSGLIFSVIPLG